MKLEKENLFFDSSDKASGYAYYYMKDGEKIRHRDDDLPARMSPRGLIWYHHGRMSRENKPSWISRSTGDDDWTARFMEGYDYYRHNGPVKLQLTNFSKAVWDYYFNDDFSEQPPEHDFHGIPITYHRNERNLKRIEQFLKDNRFPKDTRHWETSHWLLYKLAVG